MSTCTIKTASKLKPVHIVGGKEYNLSEYFKNDIGLEVDYFDFSKDIGPLIKSGVTTVEEANLGYIDLNREVTIGLVQAMLPNGYVFEDVNKFLCQLAWLIDIQSGGENGRLQTYKRFNNTFFVRGNNNEIIVTDVFWNRYNSTSADDEPIFVAEWVCSTTALKSNLKRGNGRVFSATAA